MRVEPAIGSRVGAGFLGCCLLVGASGAVHADQKPAAPKAPVSAAPVEPPDYQIAPGDVLRIAVWKEPELSASVSVRLDGKVTVPLLGDIRAAGRTPMQLTTEVREKLGRFLEVPQVTITVADAVSSRFFIVGEVQAGGAFPLTNRTTVLQAIALAKGLRQFAKADRILIIREVRGDLKAIPFNLREVERGINLDQNIALEPGDTIIIP